MKPSVSSFTRLRNPPARNSAGPSDSDYREELLSYKQITDERCEPDSWAAITRNERFNRYWRAMQSGRLRREKLRPLSLKAHHDESTRERRR